MRKRECRAMTSSQNLELSRLLVKVVEDGLQVLDSLAEVGSLAAMAGGKLLSTSLPI